MITSAFIMTFSSCPGVWEYVVKVNTWGWNTRLYFRGEFGTRFVTRPTQNIILWNLPQLVGFKETARLPAQRFSSWVYYIAPTSGTAYAYLSCSVCQEILPHHHNSSYLLRAPSPNNILNDYKTGIVCLSIRCARRLKMSESVVRW